MSKIQWNGGGKVGASGYGTSITIDVPAQVAISQGSNPLYYCTGVVQFMKCTPQSSH
jgi:hypothetical protein